jgi:hypothetical protein
VALNRGERFVSHFHFFTPDEKATCGHWTGNRLIPRASLDVTVKRKNSRRWESNPDGTTHSHIWSRDMLICF